MILKPLRMVTKTACVVPTDVEDRFAVLVYVDGKLDSAHLPTNLEDANRLVDKLIATPAPHPKPNFRNFQKSMEKLYAELGDDENEGYEQDQTIDVEIANADGKRVFVTQRQAQRLQWMYLKLQRQLTDEEVFCALNDFESQQIDLQKLNLATGRAVYVEL